jgi:hypothetical protein
MRSRPRPGGRRRRSWRRLRAGASSAPSPPARARVPCGTRSMVDKRASHSYFFFTHACTYRSAIWQLGSVNTVNGGTHTMIRGSGRSGRRTARGPCGLRWAGASCGGRGARASTGQRVGAFTALLGLSPAHDHGTALSAPPEITRGLLRLRQQVCRMCRRRGAPW